MTTTGTGATAMEPTTGAPAAESHAELLRDLRQSLAVRAWRRMRREPSLMFTVAYVFVSCIGLWANYWFYWKFGLPILEYMQASDYLVAGLRDPRYALVLLCAVAFVYVVSWPDTWRRRHPDRVESLRQHWWGRLLFPVHRAFRWKGVGMTPETGIAVAALWATAWATSAYVIDRAEMIRDDGAGQPLEVTLAGDPAPLPGQARLLGSSGAFVFLWWPGERRAEAVPIEGIGRLRQLPRAMKPATPATVAPAVRSAGSKPSAPAR